ncbi:MAG: hypothetical protein AAB436_02630 [Patescibacteria group bacterium]
MPNKKSLLVGAAVATISLAGLGSAGMVSAATTPSTSTDSTSIVDKIATKFKLNKADVKAVFDEDRSARDAERKADQAERLATAVKDGKITQAQADYITKAQAEIQALRGTSTPDTVTDAVKTQIKTKMDALHTWAKDNNVDAKYLGGGHGGHGGHGHFGGPDGEMPSTAKSTGSN